MTLVKDITTKEWSLSLTEPGAIVTDLEDINQSILIACTTDEGSDPLRPDFGNKIFRWIDKPRNQAIPNIITEIGECIEIWEKRAVLNNITWQPVGLSQVNFFIDWQTIDGRKLSTPLKLTYNL